MSLPAKQDDSNAPRAPTAKGTMLPVRKLPEFARALVKAEAEARSRGVIGDGSDE